MASSIQRSSSGWISGRPSTYQALRNSIFLGGEDITLADQPEISPMSATFLDTHGHDPRTKAASSVTMQETNSSQDFESESPQFSIKRKPVSPTSPSQKNGVQMFEERKDMPHLLSHEPPPSAAWRIRWLRPVIIILMPFLALLPALGHHFYYFSLHHTRSGDQENKLNRFDLGLHLRFSSPRVYIPALLQQLATGLDKLFDLTSNPLSLFSWELLQGVKIALFYGLLFWLLGWARVAAPATLTVVPRNINYTISIPILDLNQAGWNTSSSTWQPGAVVNRIAAQAASSSDVVPLPQQVSNALVQKFQNDSATFAWANIIDTMYNSTGSPNWLLHTTWAPGLPAGAPYRWDPIGITLAMTSTSGMVCTSLNASFDITVASVNGMQQITQQAVDIIGPYSLGMNIEYTYYKETRQYDFDGRRCYTPRFASLHRTGGIGDESSDLPRHYLLEDVNTRTNILATGLMACDDTREVLSETYVPT
ncbi:hypothetical protein BDZ45DRAFT_809167 [Acephala macrosclerotiorum]|nr:hypothetical protein BDZ45DRAFT_809167 [Acephala macrosclerotiorum]